MNELTPDSGAAGGNSAALKSLIEVGTNLSTQGDRRKVLDRILTEARSLARAEAGSLYVERRDALHFVVAQNAALPASVMCEVFTDREMPVAADSLAGYVAATGEAINIPDADAIAEDAPFRLNRSFDERTGFHTRSVLALPLLAPEGECVGVLQLINGRDGAGRVGPFDEADRPPLESLASMAALTVQNLLLQEEVRRAHLDTIMRLSVVAEMRDDETATHIRRLSRISGLIARALGLAEREVELIECAAPMHDIGKISVPDDVLRKAGPLTPDEMAIMQEHPQMGAEILGDPQCDLMDVARTVALGHHERWDGTGYPKGLKETAIPLPARIVGLADVFDALIHKRRYKVAYPLDLAVDLIRRQAGHHFDPDVVAAFLSALPEVVDWLKREGSLGPAPEPEV